MKHVITATCHTDDHRVKAEFDAEPWFQKATDDDICKLARCGWGGDYPADDVAISAASLDPQVKRMFDYIEIVKTQYDGDPLGFECHVSQNDAMKWIRKHRKDVLKMFSLVTDQGTAAGETALCGFCFNEPSNVGYAREVASQSDDVDPRGNFIDCTENDALECCICGKTAHDLGVL